MPGVPKPLLHFAERDGHTACGKRRSFGSVTADSGAVTCPECSAKMADATSGNLSPGGGLFMQAVLETDDGRYVTTGLIPPFDKWPDILCWGSRFFVLRDGKKEEMRATYREAFFVSVVQTTDKPR